MPKYWGKQIFILVRFPEVGQKQKTEREKLNDGNNNGQLRIANATSGGERKAACAKKERKRLNDGNNNGQLRTSGGARKAAWVNS